MSWQEYDNQRIARIQNAIGLNVATDTANAEGDVAAAAAAALTAAKLTDVSAVLTGSKTWDPASVDEGDNDTTTVTVTGAAVGNPVSVGFSNAVPAGAVLSAAVTATNTVTVTLTNIGAGLGLDLASGTLTVAVTKPAA